MKIVFFLTCMLACIGAINWGLVAFLKFNLVEYMDMLSGNKGLDLVIYGLIAFSGIYGIIMAFLNLFKNCTCQ